MHLYKKITSLQSYADANADISPLSVYLCSGQCSECGGEWRIVSEWRVGSIHLQAAGVVSIEL